MATCPVIGAQNPSTQEPRPGLLRSLSKRLRRKPSSSKPKQTQDDLSERSSHPVGGRILTLRALPALPRDDNDDDDIHDLVLRHTGTRVAYEDARRRVVPNSSRRSLADLETRDDHVARTEQRYDRDSHWLSQGTVSTNPASKPHPPSTTRLIPILEDRAPRSKPRHRWSRSESSSSSSISTASTTTRPLSELVTLRDMLMKRILTSQTQQRHKQQSIPGSSDIRTTSSRLIAERPLTPVQTRELLNAIDNASKLDLDVRLTALPAICAICSEPRYTLPTKRDRGRENDNTRDGPATMYLAPITAQSPSLTSDFDSKFLDNFSTELRRMACCRQHVCHSCLSRTIVRGIEQGWSRDILRRGPGWISCPVESCDAVVSLYRCNIRDVLQALGISDAERVAKEFTVAAELRSALRGMTPPPTEREIRKGLKFYRELVRMGCAYPLLEMDARNVGQIEVKRITVDFPCRNGLTGTERLQVPLFTHLLKLPRVVKECSICVETYHDLQAPSFEAVMDTMTNGKVSSRASWEKALENFSGDWTWQISHFPSRNLLPICAETHPEIHICRPCLAKHIDTQLELHGHDITPSPTAEEGRGIPCPVGECQGRKFTHLEISKLARPETFARYDRLCALSSISTHPGFRWCLRRGCESGAIYELLDTDKSLPAPPTNMDNVNGDLATYISREDNTATRSSLRLPPRPPPRTSSRRFSLATRPHDTTTTLTPQGHEKAPAISHITCHACSYEMCFTCQTPWHTNLTCTESLTLLHSSQNDPSALANYSKTKTWLLQHTKRCPNMCCSAPIEKGEGCFHMTCSACKFQFCWECLADWRGVVVDGRFVREGHADGCYFRGENAVPPTQVMGVSVERGLRRPRGMFR